MSSYIIRKTEGNTEWFRHDRFGMFIHFGLYALPARHEWVKSRETLSDEHYKRYFGHFDPDMFDAREWARQAKNAGMKYAVLTTKHHDGFCLFDTKYTDYKITNTPFGRDLVREYVDAFRAEGLKIGFYYSLLDWHHPDYTIDAPHPMKFAPDALELNKTRDMKKYCEYMRNQVTELLTNYGKIDILWFDFSFGRDKSGDPLLERFEGKTKEDWEASKLLALARKLQPGIIIDNRTGYEADLWTPEQFQPTEWVKDEGGNLVTWEACQTFSGSWGYYRDEKTWKSPAQLIEMLIKTVSLGGNLIMNVGPTARGYFDCRAEKALGEYGRWLKYNGRSIYGCTMAEPEFTAPNGCAFTQSEDGSRLYLHVFDWPFIHLTLKGIADKVEYVQFLHDASEIKYEVAKGGGNCGSLIKEDGCKDVTLILPVEKPDIIVPTIEIFLK